ncbi:hypothetical protein DFH11DRAFT_1595736 [Phellopilus nigrolimitatus]|nr:hypothetical protein DFH11DRAFT_1595736 [Phellopilus nigrolimitatus]
MPRSTARVDQTTAAKSIETSLGVKGQLRVRPYGNVKHAHVILRKVDEEEYEDSQGRTRTRGVFSLFAHKLINVKPGKELFMYLHPVGGDLEEHVVAFEADMPRADELDMDVGDSAKSEETIVQREQALPPKLRKLWARKAPMPAKQGDVAPAKVSVGVQAQPVTSFAEIQAQPSSLSVEIQVQPLSSSVEVQAQSPSSSIEIQTQPPLSLSKETQAQPCFSSIEVQAQPSSCSVEVQAQPKSSSAEIQASTCLTSSGTQTRVTLHSDGASQTSDTRTLHPHVDVETQAAGSHHQSLAQRAVLPVIAPDLKNEGSIKTESSLDSYQRSLSPMELESPPTSPEYSPELLIVDLPPVASDTKFQSRMGLQEVDDEPQLASAVTLVESPVSEPTKVQSVPSHPAYRAPTFVPAKYHQPVEQKHTSIPTPSTSKITLDSVCPLTAKARLQTSVMSRPPPTAPAALTVPVPRPAPAAPAALRSVGVRPAPTFVPATLALQPPPKPPPLPPQPTLQPEPRSVPSSRKPSRKRRRAAEAVDSSANKKWKPIVKLEPLSPVLLSSQPPPQVPESDVFDDLYGPPLPPPIAEEKKPLDKWFESVSIKAECLDTFSLSGNYAPAPAPMVYDLTRGADGRNRIDLTLPEKPLQAAAAAQRSLNMGLSTIKTAQIKMGREPGVRNIVFNQTGNFFAVICRDNTVRIWDNSTCTEIAKLAHSASVVSVAWLDGDICAIRFVLLIIFKI